MNRTFGKGHSAHYVSIVEIIVESAATYAVLEVFFISFWTRNETLVANTILWPLLIQAVVRIVSYTHIGLR